MQATKSLIKVTNNVPESVKEFSDLGYDLNICYHDNTVFATSNAERKVLRYLRDLCIYVLINYQFSTDIIT